MYSAPPPIPSRSHRWRNLVFQDFRRNFVYLLIGAIIGIIIWTFITDRLLNELYKIQGDTNCRDLYSSYLSYFLEYKQDHGNLPKILPSVIQLKKLGYSNFDIERWSAWPGFYIYDYNPDTLEPGEALTIYYIYKNYAYAYQNNGNIISLKQIEEKSKSKPILSK